MVDFVSIVKVLKNGACIVTCKEILSKFIGKAVASVGANKRCITIAILNNKQKIAKEITRKTVFTLFLLNLYIL